VRVRAGKGSRPRTRTRPEHADAAAGTVVTVDRGRYRLRLADGQLLTAIRARELGRRAVVVGDRVAMVGDLGGGPDALARIVRVEERSSLLRRTPAGRIETVAKDARLQWPDTYSFAADGNLYVANSAIHKTPSWNKGVGQPRQPFRIFKMAFPK